MKSLIEKMEEMEEKSNNEMLTLKSLLKNHLTIEMTKESDFCSSWTEITVFFDGDLIATAKGDSESYYDD